MYACYIDESGHCGAKYDPNQPVEVVVGVVSDITKLFKTQREHGKIMSRLKSKTIDVSELKAKDIYRGKNAWNGVSPEERQAVISEMLAWAEERVCKFIVCPIDSQQFFTLKDSGDEMAKKLLFPYEAGAINVILALERMKSGTRNNKGKTLVVFDEQLGHDKNVMKMMDTDEGLSFTDGFTGYVFNKRSTKNPPRLNEIIDIPFFSKSHISTLIQVADIAAFIVNKYLALNCYGIKEAFEGENKLISKWYDQIGKNAITHTHITPSTKADPLCNFYKSIRPKLWSAKEWKVI